MPLLTRLRYAFYLAVALGMMIGLFVAITTADVIGLLPIRLFDALFNPIFFAALYVVAFVFSPWVAERLPIRRAQDPND